MLRTSRRRQPESQKQKLFNLAVSHYLNSQTIEPCVYCEVFSVPDDLLQFAVEINLRVLAGSNFVCFRPVDLFPQETLTKLALLKNQMADTRHQISLISNELGLKDDTEISVAHKAYMNRLHAYNEAKDAAQALLGKLAQITGSTTKELYPKFNLSIDD